MKSFKEYIMEEKKGTYAAVRPSKDHSDKLSTMMLKHDVPNAEAHDKLHCTLLYSRKHLPDYKPEPDIEHHADVKGLEIWPTKSGKNCLVMKLHSPSLEKRHKDLMDKHEATYDYPEYKPHLSLSYDVGDNFDHKKLEKDLPKSIKLKHEYQEELDTTGK